MVFDQGTIKGTVTGEIKKVWNESAQQQPSFLPVYSEEEKKRNESWLKEKSDAIGGRMRAFPKRKTDRTTWKLSLEEVIVEALSTESFVGMKDAMPEAVMNDYRKEMQAFIRKTRAFDKRLSMEGMGQAIRNYLVYAVFRDMNGLPQQCNSAIWGYSMLYPYTDNYLDEPERTGEEKQAYNKMIGAKIKGEAFRAGSRHHKKTIQLLEAVEEIWPRAEESDLYEGLYLMLEAQAESQRQYTSDPLTPEEIQDISIYKGGVSVLIDRYLIGKPLTEADVRFYFAFGFLLQLCDDLQDIGSDRESGSKTLFSMCRDETDTDQMLYRLLHYTKRIFEECHCEREHMKEFLFRCTCLLILFSAEGSGIYLSKEAGAYIAKRLPFSKEVLLSETKGLPIGEQLGEKEEKKYFKLLDYFCAE